MAVKAREERDKGNKKGKEIERKDSDKGDGDKWKKGEKEGEEGSDNKGGNQLARIKSGVI